MSFELLDEIIKDIENAETIEELIDIFIDAVDDFPAIDFGQRVQKRMIELNGA